jgi:hypothetical protein
MILCGDYAAEKQTEHDRETIVHSKYLQRITMHRDGGLYLPARLVLLPAARYYVTDLIKRPGDFAQSPDNRVGSRMDVLSTQC